MPLTDEEFADILKNAGAVPIPPQQAAATNQLDTAIPLAVALIKELLPLLQSGETLKNAKSLFASKTFWGGIAAIVPFVVQAFGYTIGGADVVQLQELLPTLVAAVGGLTAIFGRIAATKKVG